MRKIDRDLFLGREAVPASSNTETTARSCHYENAGPCQNSRGIHYCSFLSSFSLIFARTPKNAVYYNSCWKVLVFNITSRRRITSPLSAIPPYRMWRKTCAKKWPLASYNYSCFRTYARMLFRKIVNMFKVYINFIHIYR